MYGFFKCLNCNSEWESSHVYYEDKERGTFLGHNCKTCNTTCQPYKVEETTCSSCGTCGCDKTHHTDPNKPHMSELCDKCQSGNSCE
ncbi:zygote arrest protein 1.S-like [Ruditapes philippinarum]|uniref:zygote arrest protein 1.S-like n=1 Tax=Ruditapes philippinarum TaxID=129788 RepID=UPI00295A7B73|nr:zygote arrest protein 1.S-like [Ruditapes philippinarum]